MNESQSVFRLFRLVHKKIAKQGNIFLKKEGLTLVQGQALMFLFHQQDHCASMKELERELEVAQSTSAALVARLEKNGFLTLLPDPQDKRVKHVKLTEKSENFLTKIKKTMQEVDKEVLSALTPVEQTMLLQLLNKLADSLSDLPLSTEYD